MFKEVSVIYSVYLYYFHFLDKEIATKYTNEFFKQFFIYKKVKRNLMQINKRKGKMKRDQTYEGSKSTKEI